jgi:acetyl esterase/lipase
VSSRRSITHKWNLLPLSNIGIRFSAGGHLAATLSTQYDEKSILQKDSISAKLSFSILVYPVISMTNKLPAIVHAISY